LRKRAHRNHPAIASYIPLLQAARPHEELYDCLADPDQVTNLAARAEFAAVRAELRKKLEDYQRATRDPRVTGEMATFQETLRFVQDRKKQGYSDTRDRAKKQSRG